MQNYISQVPAFPSPWAVPQLPMSAQFPLEVSFYPRGFIEACMPGWLEMVRENEHLRNRIAQKEFAEQAYMDIRDFNNCLCTQGKFGRSQVVLNHTIERAIYFNCHPLLNLHPFYVVQLVDIEQAVLIPEEVFYKDVQLISTLRRMTGVEVHTQQSSRKTADLLRQAIDRQAKEVYLDYYSGWKKVEGEWRFLLLPPFLSHQCQPYTLVAPQCIDKISAAVTATAASQFWDVFRVFGDEFTRKMLYLVFHAAALYTLLEGLGYKLPLAFAFFSDNPDQTAHLRQLFSWFGDPAPSPCDTPKSLSLHLLTRKDQPVLIVDSGKPNAESMDVLDRVLSTGVVSVKIGRAEKEFPVQGPVVILSNRVSALTVAPDVMVLELPSVAFNRELWMEIADCAADNSDYLSGFIGFTETHIFELQEALKQRRKEARQLSGGELDEQRVEILGLFLGLDAYMEKFSSYCTGVIAPVVPFNETTRTAFVELLCQTMDKELCVNLADQFLAVGRAQIERGTVQTYHKEQAPKTEIGPIVYFDREYLYFSSTAFFQVCDALSQSRPAVLKSLAEAGLFGGRQVNATTAQTRITVCNVYGQRQSIKVYAVCRAAFDEIRIGDPLILDGEDQL